MDKVHKDKRLQITNKPGILEEFKRSNVSTRSQIVITRWHVIIKNVVLVIFYYAFSIGLTFYNKKVVRYIKLPLSMTVVQLASKFVAAVGVRSVMEFWDNKERVTLPWNVYMRRVSLAGICTGLDIALSNWSFEFITVSLYTMTKCSSVIFILLFALCFKLERFSYKLIVIVMCISSGLFIFTYKSTQFEWHGFTLVLTAAVLSGLRMNLAQMVLQKKELGLSHPVDMMYHMEPWMLLGLIPLAVGAEHDKIITSSFGFRYHDSTIAVQTLVFTLFGAVLSFFLQIGEFLLLYHTSSLTLTVAGAVKEVITLYIAYEFSGDRMSRINTLGLVVCLIGISIHVVIKYKRSRKVMIKRTKKVGNLK